MSKDGKISIKMMGQWYGEGKKELMIRELVQDFSFYNQDINATLEFPYQTFKKSGDIDFFSFQNDSVVKMIQTNNWPFDIIICDESRYLAVGDKVKDQNWGKTYLEDFSNEQWFKDAHKSGLIESQKIP